jgi:hypothetical protein
MRPLLSTNPVATFVLDPSGAVAISKTVWALVSASVLKAGTAVEIFNSTGSTLQISQGAVGAETATGAVLPYTIPLGGSAFILPMEIKSGKPISVLGLDNASTTGLLVINLFG